LMEAVIIYLRQVIQLLRLELVISRLNAGHI